MKLKEYLVALACLVLLVPPSRGGDAPRIETIAGTGVRGFSGDGGLAIHAQINDPYGLTLGPDGALYFCDMGNQRIRRVDLQSGIITTVVGRGARGWTPDNHPPKELALNEPYEVRFHPDGRLFFVEMRNALARAVDLKTGKVATIAGNGQRGFSGDGGQGPQASLNQPHAIQFGPDGRLYICDIGNHRVRAVDLASGLINTVDFNEKLNGPRAIDFDSRGGMWLALREGNAIYRIDRTRGMIHHAATNLAGPKGLTISRGGLVIWADTESHTVRYLDPRFGAVHLLAGTGQRGDGPDGDPLKCALARPHGVFADTNDVLYIGDSENHRVRRMTLPPAFERARWLARMEQVMGAFPGPAARGDLNVEVSEEADLGEYTRKLLTYESSPGQRVPAYLLTPKRIGGKKPIGILALHQTRAEGHKVVVGLAGSPNDEYGVELVKRGYIVLAPSYPHLANYAPDLSGYESGTMRAIWDNVRGLDLLATWAGADPARFAAIGHSLGGHNSLYTAAFDERVKVVVTSCGFDSFRDYMNGNIKGWTSHRYMPKLLDYAPDRYPFDFDHVLAAIGPRAVFVSAPLGDTNFKWESVDRVVARAKELNSALDVTVEHPDAPHVFPPEARGRAYQFVEQRLR